MSYKGKKQKKIKPKYPSEFGSHRSMVCDKWKDKTVGIVVCEDDRGKYVTTTKWLDNGFADINRNRDLEGRERRLEYFMKFEQLRAAQNELAR